MFSSSSSFKEFNFNFILPFLRNFRGIFHQSLTCISLPLQYQHISPLWLWWARSCRLFWSVQLCLSVAASVWNPKRAIDQQGHPLLRPACWSLEDPLWTVPPHPAPPLQAPPWQTLALHHLNSALTSTARWETHFQLLSRSSMFLQSHRERHSSISPTWIMLSPQNAACWWPQRS